MNHFQGAHPTPYQGRTAQATPVVERRNGVQGPPAGVVSGGVEVRGRTVDGQPPGDVGSRTRSGEGRTLKSKEGTLYPCTATTVEDVDDSRFTSARTRHGDAPPGGLVCRVHRDLKERLWTLGSGLSYFRPNGPRTDLRPPSSRRPSTSTVLPGVG